MEQRLPDPSDAFSQASQASSQQSLPGNKLTATIAKFFIGKGYEIFIPETEPAFCYIHYWLDHRNISDEENERTYLLSRCQQVAATQPPLAHDWVLKERAMEFERCKKAISIIRPFITDQSLADAAVKKANNYFGFLSDLTVDLYAIYTGSFKLPPLLASPFQQQDNTTGNNQPSIMNININGNNNNISNVETMTGNINYAHQDAEPPKQLPQALTYDQARHLIDFMIEQKFADAATDRNSALYLLGVSSEPPAKLRPIYWRSSVQLLRELLIPAFRPAFENKLVTQKAFSEELVPACFVGKDNKPIVLHNNAPSPCRESDAIEHFLKNDF